MHTLNAASICTQALRHSVTWWLRSCLHMEKTDSFTFHQSNTCTHAGALRYLMVFANMCLPLFHFGTAKNPFRILKMTTSFETGSSLEDISVKTCCNLSLVESKLVLQARSFPLLPGLRNLTFLRLPLRRHGDNWRIMGRFLCICLKECVCVCVCVCAQLVLVDTLSKQLSPKEDEMMADGHMSHGHWHKNWNMMHLELGEEDWVSQIRLHTARKRTPEIIVL